MDQFWLGSFKHAHLQVRFVDKRPFYVPFIFSFRRLLPS